MIEKEMGKLEEIFNNLISIDDECKRILRELKEKQDNIEYLVNNELSKRKDEIKTKYKFKFDLRKSEYDTKLTEKLKSIDEDKFRQIEEINYQYETDKQEIISEIIQSILKK